MPGSDRYQCDSMLMVIIFSFAVIYLCFIVSAKKQRKKYKDLYASTSSEETEESDEVMPFTDGVLDLRGGVRRYFALEAALLDHGRNVICSPLSALMPLGKLLIGANKKAKLELIEAIGLKSSKQLKSSFSQLITNIEYLPGVTLDMASRVYVAYEKTINSRYKEQAKLIFKTSIQLIDPLNPRQTAAKINNWVAEKTKNKITKMISSSDISKDTSLVLINAVYFAGKWKHPFEKSYTDVFYSPRGTRRLPMMSRQGRYKYWKSDDLNAEIIEIPYEGSQASMIIVLPFSKTGLPVLLRELKLSPKLLNKALEKMKTANVKLSMPKFKIESELDLIPLYKKIGLHKIFDHRASDLSRIIEDEEVYVSSAKQKAVIEVNEKGTEAAAATGMVIETLSAWIVPEIIVNHPFLFYIKMYQEQLFSGVFAGN